MKTIRTNCFETNSSSTHSITILSKKNSETVSSTRPLEKDGVLYPANLRWTNAYRDDNRDGYTLHASTVAEKTALLIHHIMSLRCYGEYEKEHIDRALGAVIGAVTNVYKIFRSVDMTDLKDFNFNCSSEDETTYLQLIMEKGIDEVEKEIVLFIHSTVMDDDKIIIDCEDSY